MAQIRMSTELQGEDAGNRAAEGVASDHEFLPTVDRLCEPRLHHLLRHHFPKVIFGIILKSDTEIRIHQHPTEILIAVVKRHLVSGDKDFSFLYQLLSSFGGTAEGNNHFSGEFRN